MVNATLTTNTLQTPTSSSKFVKIKMATIFSASEFPPEEGTRNVPRSDPTPDNDNERCPDNSTNFLLTSLCNIWGHRSNFNSGKHHFSSKHQLLFLIEIVSEATDGNLYSAPSRFFYPKFHTKAGCCVYVCNETTCSRAHNLDSSEFSTIWVKLNLLLYY